MGQLNHGDGKESVTLGGLFIEASGLGDSLASAVEAVARTEANIKRQFQPFVNSMLNGLADLSRRAAQRAESFSRDQAEWERKHNEALEWLLKFGWPPLMQATLGTPALLQSHCSKMTTEQAQKEIDDSVVQYHDESLLRRQVLADWEKRPELEARLPILRAAINAHIRGEYALSVPALLAQIEGVVVDCVGHSGHLRLNTYQQYLDSLFEGGVLPEYTAMYRRFVFEVVLATFRHGDAILFTLNRHAILHGADINYANAATSLRSILLLDFILSRTVFAAFEEQKEYHRLSCPRLKVPGRRIVYCDEFQAWADRKDGCSVCETKNPQAY